MPKSILSLDMPFISKAPRENLEFAAAAAVRGGGLVLGRIAMGFLGAAYVCMGLVFLMVVAAILGVGLVRFWVEEPVNVTENLYFEYADAHPTAVFSFGDGGKKSGVPLGQTLHVSLILLVPESDYNRDVGIFQVTAEILSAGENLMAKSSHPCMLQFRSLPIRVIRTFLMSIPLLLGITDETQMITFPILKNYKEPPSLRTREIRITLKPRAGTYSLPHFYDAKIVVQSRMPWAKQVVYMWKWTFYVWTTLYIYTIMLAMILAFYVKPVINSIILVVSGSDNHAKMEFVDGLEKLDSCCGRVQEEVGCVRRPWERSKNKRKASGVLMAGEDGSSACSLTVSGVGFEEGIGDSESVCSAMYW
ncbi:Seipin [Dorcoceras hygrometricum]|uniref:Seipin n=1 Tax=Dorcoceras hygrometricum TaxID=472368 RepID=A0A2Z7BT87_9LAMI|nr:Seipin [Dorcoceras hygrometricum]